jgi:hypothetical protein
MHSVSSDLRVATATRRLPRKKVARELSASRCPTDPGGRALHQLGPIPRPPDQQSLNHESNESHESNPSIPIRPIRAIRGPSLDVRSATHHPRPLAPSAAKKPWRPWQRWRLVESSLQRPASRVDSREPSTEPLFVSPSPSLLVCFRLPLRRADCKWQSAAHTRGARCAVVQTPRNLRPTTAHLHGMANSRHPCRTPVNHLTSHRSPSRTLGRLGGLGCFPPFGSRCAELPKKLKNPPPEY